MWGKFSSYSEKVQNKNSCVLTLQHGYNRHQLLPSQEKLSISIARTHREDVSNATKRARISSCE